MEKEIKKRKITSLFHFTQYENLSSILINGIIPRCSLDILGSAYAYNDESRLDGYQNASCLSISHPNYKMFYYLRKQSPQLRWVVIRFKSDILLNKNCLFCHFNAASSEETTLAIENKQGLQGLRRMFSDNNSFNNRKTLNIPDNYPTNPQAEVLVFDKIETTYISAIYFNIEELCTAEKMKYSNSIPPFDLLYDYEYFYPRLDHAYWRL